MSQWSGADRAFVIEAYLKGGESYVTARRKFCLHRKIKRVQDAPSSSLIRKWVQKFRSIGSVLNQPRPGPSKTSRTEEAIKQVADSLRRNPDLSLRKRAAALNITKSTLERILKNDLKSLNKTRRERATAKTTPRPGPKSMPPRQDLVVQPPVIRVEQTRPPPPPPPGRLQRPPHDHPSTYLRRPANPPRDARLVNTVANTQ